MDKSPGRMSSPELPALALAGVWLVAVSTADATTGTNIILPDLLAVTPVISAVAVRPRFCVVVAVASTVSAALLGIRDHDLLAVSHLVATVTVMLVGALSVYVSLLRSRATTALQRAEFLASTDPLTGLLNRRSLTERSQALLDLRPRPQLWVLELDLDHFKSVNDHYGHLVGDEVLEQFAARARSELRAGDLLCRVGGEEFMLVLAADGEPGALEAVERVRRNATGQPFTTSGGEVVLTFSAGLASIAAEEVDLVPATRRADRALYASKNSGRSRTTVA